MARTTDTGIVRSYCENNVGGVFDLNYLANNIFKDIPHVNLRKIVTRLIDSGLLRQVSKGVYLIGESELSDEERTIMIAIKNNNKITREELARLIDKNIRTVQRILNGLVSSRYLIRIGKNRFGYWEVIN